MIIKNIYLINIALLFTTVQLYSQDAQTKSVDINALVNMMQGSFSSEEQSKNDSDYYDISLHMKKIWTDRIDGKWLYVEQAAANSPEKPYRQRVYRVTQNADGSFQSAVFTMKDPLRFAGEWQKENPLADLSADSLTAREGCTVYLSLVQGDKFKGSTKDNDCQSDLRGAKYATSEVTISKDGIVSWDRGYDENGVQVWGAVKEGYVFKRIE